MASGYGYSGGTARCHPFWLEFSKCWASADAPSQCANQADDYMECLHHKKEIARAQEVKAHFIKKQLHENKEGKKVADIVADGVIGSVGLIPREGPKDGEDKSKTKK
ncbi:hypothetical protein FRB94_009909 [Tulasnella sp. JGI-2019a]|nr:hypothetical protein FRB93_007921 [Tulasnella sp. JGI-2019a]KAG8994423.1 hypothetical protein FRB94_009909 [Tulasnella sp. JGI-2019a]KAG9034620.1 hypothetical protein FRB95_012940 [Tulasnella sp. JGI-2019a]